MTINCKGQLIDLSKPKIMAILNVTPDSFFDGGKYSNEKNILDHVEKCLVDGATFIDVGAYSSRPGASEVTENMELLRILPIVKLIINKFPETILSIDTFRSEVASACVQEGAAIINDISSGQLDDKMMDTIARLNVPYILMHMRGTPKTMLSKTEYDDIVQNLLHFFSEKVGIAQSKGIRDIIIDPGFGFAKNLEQNYVLFSKIEQLKTIELPILLGISRKSMIYKLLDTTAEYALNGTSALHMLGLYKGANILRVHDVKEAMECIKIHNQLIS
ncbi:dihydropteroate synthase [Maribacter sp. CXY002]|uniref:dihydropteroate synthase n=1 Tax=Maribacter luteocoastalis TaxID=3407671 RepID=UPI003B67592A